MLTEHATDKPIELERVTENRDRKLPKAAIRTFNIMLLEKGYIKEFSYSTTGQNLRFGSKTGIQWIHGRSGEELDEIVNLLLEKATQHKEQFLHDLTEIEELVALKQCINVFVASYFGYGQAPCGHCSWCLNQKENNM